jgi:hypothetical protein
MDARAAFRVCNGGRLRGHAVVVSVGRASYASCVKSTRPFSTIANAGSNRAPCRCPKLRHSLSARHSVRSLPARPVRTAHRGSACWEDFEVGPKRRSLARKQFSMPRNGKAFSARRLDESIEKSAFRARQVWSPAFFEALRARLFLMARSQRPCHQGNSEARLRSCLARKEIR